LIVALGRRWERLIRVRHRVGRRPYRRLTSRRSPDRPIATRHLRKVAASRQHRSFRPCLHPCHPSCLHPADRRRASAHSLSSLSQPTALTIPSRNRSVARILAPRWGIRCLGTGVACDWAPSNASEYAGLRGTPADLSNLLTSTSD